MPGGVVPKRSQRARSCASAPECRSTLRVRLPDLGKVLAAGEFSKSPPALCGKRGRRFSSGAGPDPRSATSVRWRGFSSRCHIGRQPLVLPSHVEETGAGPFVGFSLSPFPELRRQLVVVREAFGFGHRPTALKARGLQPRIDRPCDEAAEPPPVRCWWLFAAFESPPSAGRRQYHGRYRADPQSSRRRVSRQEQSAEWPRRIVQSDSRIINIG